MAHRRSAIRKLRNGWRRRVDIISWAPYEIQVELPASGQGSFGDVVVENGSIGQHKSNPRQLTEWRGTFMLEGVDVDGGLKRNVSFGVHFRADLQNHRYAPDQELISGVFGDGIVPVFGATDCIGVVSSEGSQVWDNGYTETWDNGPDTVLPIHDGVSPLTQFMQCYGEIDLLQSKLFLIFMPRVNTTAPCAMTRARS